MPVDGVVRVAKAVPDADAAVAAATAGPSSETEEEASTSAGKPLQIPLDTVVLFAPENQGDGLDREPIRVQVNDISRIELSANPAVLG